MCNPSNADGQCRQGIPEACGTDTQCTMWREEPLSSTVWKTRPNTQDYPLPFTCIPWHAHSLHPWTHTLKHMKINNLVLSIMGRDGTRSSVKSYAGSSDRPWQFCLSCLQVYKRTDLEPKLTSDFQSFESLCTSFLQRVSSCVYLLHWVVSPESELVCVSVTLRCFREGSRQWKGRSPLRTCCTEWDFITVFRIRVVSELKTLPSWFSFVLFLVLEMELEPHTG